MPRKFLDADKRKWLELYDSGKSEKWIAKQHAKCDARTVKRGIEEARRIQDAKIARTELIKDALRNHQSLLLEELEQISSALTVPPEDFAALSWYHTSNSIFTSQETMTERQISDVSEIIGAVGDQGEAVRRLLKQHLKNDRLWKVLAQWEKAYTAHLTARVALQRRTVTLLEEKTGCKLVDENKVPSPFLWSYTTGDLFYKAVLQKAFGSTIGIDLQCEIVINTLTGELQYHNSILAVAPGNEQKIKANLLDALEELKASAEVVSVMDTYKTLQGITLRARQIIEQIKLLGLVLGQCEICRRLGI